MRKNNISFKRQNKNNFLLKLIYFLFIIFFIFCIYFYYSYSETTQNTINNSDVSFEIPASSSVKKIGEILEKSGVIASSFNFNLYFRLNENIDKNFKAGTYTVGKNISFEKLLEILRGKNSQTKITIPEGSSTFDIEEILIKKGLIKEGDLFNCIKKCDFASFEFIKAKNIEGYLFPDTYFVNPSEFNIKFFMERMFGNFRKKVLSSEVGEKIISSKRSFDDIIKMASIIEREEMNPENMKIVSGILWKRLDKKIYLGVDATTRYFKKDKTGELYASDFTDKNLYNTRINLGLPPTAISNPGIQAIITSLEPEESDYYYYLHDSNGEIHFAKTNEEHNDNKYKYLR